MGRNDTYWRFVRRFCRKSSGCDRSSCFFIREAVSLCITMAGITAMWTGIMKIAENAGLVSQLAGRMRPVLKFLFPGLEPDSPACHYISLNFFIKSFWDFLGKHQRRTKSNGGTGLSE